MTAPRPSEPALIADLVRGDIYRQCVESGQAMGAEIDAVEEVLIDQAGVDGMSLADCAKALLAQRDEYRDNLIDLLDSLERGDGYQQRERMTRAGLLLGFARYAEHSDGEADA